MNRILTIIFCTCYSFSLFGSESNKILVIGDSLTEGYKVKTEDAWPSLIQKKLQASKDFKQYKIINAGSSCYKRLWYICPLSFT